MSRKQSNAKRNKRNYDKSKKVNSNRNQARHENDADTKGQIEDSYSSNDIAWWNRTTLYPYVVRVPFNRVAAVPVNTENFCYDNGVLRDDVHRKLTTYSSLVRINYDPVIGYSGNGNSAVNRCFTSIQAALYAKTTGAMQFTQAQLAFNTLALDSITTNIALVKRALDISSLWSAQNSDYPRKLLRMLGFDPDEIIGHQDEIARELNDIIRNVNALKAVGFLSVYDRHYALARHIYADEDVINAPLYAFVPKGYYVFVDDGDKYETPEYLEYREFLFDEEGMYAPGDSAGQPGVYSLELLETLKVQLEAIRHSSSFYLVSGSLQRAFPDARLLSIDPVDPNYMQTPKVDRNILWQIENMVTVGEATNMDVYEDVIRDQLIFEPKTPSTTGDRLCTGHFLAANQRVISSYDYNVGDEFIMEATRLMPYVEPYMSTDPTQFIGEIRCGTELVYNFVVYSNYSEDIGGEILTSQTRYQTYLNVPNSGIDDDIAEMKASELRPLLNLTHAPTVYAVSWKFAGDAENYTIQYKPNISMPLHAQKAWSTIDKQSLYGLHEAALLSVYSTIADTNVK